MTTSPTMTKCPSFPFIHLARYLDEFVPMKAQKGLSSMDVVFNSIDVTSNYIVIGTNIGITYLYDRSTGEGQKLKCEGLTTAVTCVRCLETVDLMVAIGSSDGLIVVFQISRQQSETKSANYNSKMKMYLITNLHSHQISCLEWSRNGMKLVSGDEKGVVGQSEMDYTKNISKSQVLLKEPHAIVQLCYQHKLVLVSTLHRTLLCNAMEDATPLQVGQKDRKSLGKYGACFYSPDDNPRNVVVLASRPSLRLWKANTEGKVLETFIFKEELPDSCQLLTLTHIRQVAPAAKMCKADSQFGELHPCALGAISWSARKLFIVEMREPCLTACCEQFSGVVQVAACDDEMFVLEKPRLITRIARSPDRVADVEVSPRDDSVLLNQLKMMPSALKDLEIMIKNKSGLSATSIFGILTKPSAAPIVRTFGADQKTCDVTVDLQCPPPVGQLTIDQAPDMLYDAQTNSTHVDVKRYNAGLAGYTESAEDHDAVVSPLQGDPVNDADLLVTDGSKIGESVSDALGLDSGEEGVNQMPNFSTDCRRTSGADQESVSFLTRSGSRERWRNSSPAPNETSDPDDDDGGIVFQRRTGRRNGRKIAVSGQEKFGAEKSDSSSQGSQCDVDVPSLWNDKELSSTPPDLSPLVNQPEQSVMSTASSRTREEKEKLLAKMLDLSALFSDTGGGTGDVASSAMFPGAPDPFVYPYVGPDSLGDRLTTSDQTSASGADLGRVSPIPGWLDRTRTPASLGSVTDEDGAERCDSGERSSGHTFNNYEEILGSYLGYGPPSGSSNVASLPEIALVPANAKLSLAGDRDHQSYSTKDTSEVEPEVELEMDTNSNDVIRDVSVVQEVAPCDGVWVQHKSPGHIQSLSVCEHYIVCSDIKEAVYYSALNGMGLDWRKTDYLAKQISVSPTGSRLWRVYRNSAYVLVDPGTRGPFGRKWLEVSLDAVHVTVSEDLVWCVTQTGDVHAQNPSRQSTHSRPVDVSHPVYGISQVACNRSGVWALSVEGHLLCRTGITTDDVFGKDWREISLNLGGGVLTTIAFGCWSSLWVVDDSSNVWFNPDETKYRSSTTKTRWWQVKTSDFVYQNKTAFGILTNALMGSLHADHLTAMITRTGHPCIASTGSRGLWLYLPNHQTLYTNHGDIRGHHWRAGKSSKLCPNPRLMIASGVYQSHGALWIWQPGHQLYCLSSNANSAQPLTLPECNGQAVNLQCVGAAPETLWLLTDTGRVFIRKDISDMCHAGKKWMELDLTQISNHKLIHVSCGPNVVWACNHKGAILMRIGSLLAPSIQNFSPAWVPVTDDNVPSSSVPVFVKVFVGPLDYIVWAIDTKNNLYVREGIFPELLIGLGWVLVSGIKAISLAISEVAVYALSTSLTVYRRYNISRSNYIGDYWMELPCPEIRLLSVTVDDKLWAINAKNDLIRHESHVLAGNDETKESGKSNVKTILQRQPSVEDGWEVI